MADDETIEVPRFHYEQMCAAVQEAAQALGRDRGKRNESIAQRITAIRNERDAALSAAATACPAEDPESELSLSLAREQRLREILDALTLAAGRYERAMLSGEATFRTMERGLHLAGLEAAKAYHALSSVPDGEGR